MEDKYLAFYQTIGKRIRDARIRSGMSQAELAEKTGISLPAISSLENARSKIWLVTFARICEALEVSPDDILRLNTPAPTSGFPEELTEILDGCSPSEADSILSIARQVKAALETQKKEYTD